MVEMMIIEKQRLEQAETFPYSQEEELRINKLQHKKNNQLFEIAFCGHFSAGKSTILNTLLGAEVLPTSPIPTSANIIEIKNGEQGLTVNSKSEVKQVWNGEIPWHKVREWGMNGNQISKMTITAPLPFLGEHSCILDTPGVDSTDETHESVTVEQLYTTDAIVYVMDYNHVQSETNLYFLKQLSVEKKPIYLVINQIDKHNESEIPFSIFKKSVEDVFRAWDIHYIGLYFTSMKKQEHPLNQFPLLEQHLKALLFQSSQLMNDSLQRLEHGFYHAVKNRLEAEKQEAIHELIEELKEKGFQQSQLAEKEQLTEQLQRAKNYQTGLWQYFDSELGKLFGNVTLFPALTTDKARDWIESIQPDFKVGVFFTKNKTAAEQEDRLKRLLTELQDKVKAQLLFHVQVFFQKVDRTLLTNQDQFEDGYNQLELQLTKQLLKDHVRTDHSNREYVYTFTGEMTKLIVKEIRQNAKALIEIQIIGMKHYFEKEANKLAEKLLTFQEIEYYQLKIEEVETDFNGLLKVVVEKLTLFTANQKYNQRIILAMKGAYPEVAGQAFTNVTLESDSVITTDIVTKDNATTVNFSEEDTARWLVNVKEALQKNQKTSILNQDRENLLERINRYQKQQFIVSLFGAFSAGKSSFANALLGCDVLPVSPNPTTATVSTVKKSTIVYPHGTAVVTVKSKQSLNDEITAISEQLELSLTIDNINNWQPKKQEFISSWQKTYLQYLATIKASFEISDWKLGSQFTVPHGQLQGFVADETKACLIEEVTIYYDSPITEKGIVLVDTPGVNSIHGRHTNVAFKQMRSSDAIFYLTYYNHAFSKADQYFLEQMGQVNESFKHDKLYFVINAADLAQSQGELNGVRKHVYDQLVKNKIDQPRLYDLSSREGLQGKQEQLETKTSFSQFEQAFYEYTILELKQLSVKMITADLSNFVEKINDSVAFMNAKKKVQLKKQAELKIIVRNETKRVNEVSLGYAVRDVFQEFDQLVLYLRERMRFVLNDYFSTAINVAVLTGKTKNQLQEQLTTQIKEWRGLGEYFLKQELEATVIRIEEAIKKRASKWLKDEETILQKQLPFIYVNHEIKIDPIDVPLQDLHLLVETDNYRSYMKSKKDFFEQGKVKELKEVLVTDGVDQVSTVIEASAKRYRLAFEQQFLTLDTSLKQRLVTTIESELARFEALLDPLEKKALLKEHEDLRRFTC